jgi:hypothetical protein
MDDLFGGRCRGKGLCRLNIQSAPVNHLLLVEQQETGGMADRALSKPHRRRLSAARVLDR